MKPRPSRDDVDRLLHNRIVFGETLRVVLKAAGVERELTFDEFFNETFDEFNSTDWQLMKCALVLSGSYRHTGPRDIDVRVVPGTMTYLLQPDP